MPGNINNSAAVTTPYCALNIEEGPTTRDNTDAGQRIKPSRVSRSATHFQPPENRVNPASCREPLEDIRAEGGRLMRAAEELVAVRASAQRFSFQPRPCLNTKRWLALVGISLLGAAGTGWAWLSRRHQASPPPPAPEAAGLLSIYAGPQPMWVFDAADDPAFQRSLPEPTNAATTAQQDAPINLMKRTDPDLLPGAQEEDDHFYTPEPEPDTLVEDWAKLSSYDTLLRAARVPPLFRELVIDNMSRDFYNRYFFPLLSRAMENLGRFKISKNYHNLIHETDYIIANVLSRLESLDIIHGLSIDSIYDWLIMLRRDFRNLWDDLGEGTSMVEWHEKIELRKDLAATVSLNDIYAIRNESLTLIKRLNQDEIAPQISNRLATLKALVDRLYVQCSELSAQNFYDTFILNSLRRSLYNFHVRAINKLQAVDPHFLPHNLMTPELQESRPEIRYLSPLYDLTSYVISWQKVIPLLIAIYLNKPVSLDDSEANLLNTLINHWRKDGMVAESPSGLQSQREAILFASKVKDDATIIALTGGTIAAGELSVLVDQFRKVMADQPTGERPAGAAGGAAAVAAHPPAMFPPVNADIGPFPPIGPIQEPVPVPDGSPGGGFQRTGAIKKMRPFKSQDETPARPLDLNAYPAIIRPSPESGDLFFINQQRLEEAARAELKGVDFIIAHGLTEEISGEVPPYIAKTQKIIRKHINEADNMMTELAERLITKENDRDFLNYLQQYFSEALLTDDPSIVNTAIRRFKKVVENSNEFFKQVRTRNYDNIYIVSSKQQQRADSDEYVSLLTDAELSDVPLAFTRFQDNPFIAVVSDTTLAMQPTLGNLVKDRYQLQNVMESLIHESTHAASGTRDFFYVDKTLTGRNENARGAMETLRNLLQDETSPLEPELIVYLYIFRTIRAIPTPENLSAFVEARPFLRSYLFMHNADSLTTVIRDIWRHATAAAHPPL